MINGCGSTEKRWYEDVIAAEQQKLRLALEFERDQNGGYEVWYQSLADFRKSVSNQFILFSIGKNYLRNRNLLLATGDYIDHHVAGYFAPLEYMNTGWGGRKLLPEEQLIELSRFFQKHKKRFIYVALPCKGVIHPELIGDTSLIRGRSTVAPQWRRVLLEMLKNDVEVIDLLPRFNDYKPAECDGSVKAPNSSGGGSVPVGTIFEKSHRISPIGAKIVADTVADYLKITSDFSGFSPKIRLEREKELFFERHPGNGNASSFYTANYIYDKNPEKKPYCGGEGAKIGVFGDCNLQAGLKSGYGILSNLAYDLGIPIAYGGRVLPFEEANHVNAVSEQAIVNLLKRDIIIYVGFPSSAFVRPAVISYHRVLKRRTLRVPWSTLDLEKL